MSTCSVQLPLISKRGHSNKDGCCCHSYTFISLVGVIFMPLQILYFVRMRNAALGQLCNTTKTLFLLVSQVCWSSMLLGETRLTWEPCWTARDTTGLPPGKDLL